MKKINADVFLNKFITVHYKGYSEQFGCEPLGKEVVNEFKVGKKYVYAINTSHQNGSALIDIHSRLNSELLSLIPLNHSAKAFIPGNSYIDFLEPHRNNFCFLRVDLKNFFHSISGDLLRDVFKSYFSDEKINDTSKQQVIDAFINLISLEVTDEFENKSFTSKSILPMGFKTSPAISNIVFRKLDFIIEEFCFKHKTTYSRYADDMLFSSKAEVKTIYNSAFKKEIKYSAYLHSDGFINELKILLKIDDFKINTKKTIKSLHTISLNGYTIQGSNFSDEIGTLRVSNKKTIIISKLIYKIKKGDSARSIMSSLFGFTPSSIHIAHTKGRDDFIKKYCKDQINNKLNGYCSYLISLIKHHKAHHSFKHESIEKYGLLIKEIKKIIPYH